MERIKKWPDGVAFRSKEPDARINKKANALSGNAQETLAGDVVIVTGDPEFIKALV